MRILIIGANGYIGAWLSSSLALSGNSVTALCYPYIPNDHEWCSLMQELVVADVSSEQDIDKVTDQYYDVAIHLVSLDHHDSNNEPGYVNSINVMPVWNILEAFKRKNTLKKFIYFSTIQVYGKIPFKVIKEYESASPINPYGLTHLLAENICDMYNNSSEIDCVIVRLSNSYGDPIFPNNNCWWLAINDLCKAAYFDKKILLLSDGSPQRDFIHMSDVYNAIKTLIIGMNEKNTSNLYHLSSGKTITILEAAHVIKNIYKKRYNNNIEVILDNGNVSIDSKIYGKIDRYTISNKKLRSLGFIPTTEIADGVKRMFQYFERQNGFAK